MRHLTKSVLLSCLFATVSTVSTSVMAQSPVTNDTQNALFIVTSESLQTQGMSMVLANAMMQQGTKVNILLCDKAGDLALKTTNSETLKPQNVTPEGIMGKMLAAGAQVQVCALYLPNKGATASDLRDGITVAKPPEMAALMGRKDIKVFSN